jgi:chromatin remodeling complex protein RSC6
MAKKIAQSTETMPANTTPAPVAAAAATPARRVRRAKADEATPAEAVAAPAVAPVAPAPSTATPEPVAVEASGAEEVSEEDSLLRELTDALEQVRAEKVRLTEIGKNLATLVENLVKKTTKALRKSNKSRRQRRKANPNSGFQKPVAVTNELCMFLGRPEGTLISRTEVTRMIRDYIKEKSLQNPEDRRIITPDAQLSGLLRLEKDEKLTYFTLQSKMNHLFIKA